MNELNCAVSHADPSGSGQRDESQLQILGHLDGDNRDAGSSVQEGKVGIFSEVGNVVFSPKDGVVRRELFVSNNMLNRFIKLTLLALVPTFLLKMSGKIATPSSKTGAPSPFAFGSRLEIREWVDRRSRGDMTDDMVRNVRFDSRKRISVCT
jgi:hypothetical protein